MDDKVRCQNCGMPIEAQTVGEMVQSSIDYMTANLGFERDQATQMPNDVIRGLKRWN